MAPLFVILFRRKFNVEMKFLSDKNEINYDSKSSVKF